MKMDIKIERPILPMISEELLTAPVANEPRTT